MSVPITMENTGQGVLIHYDPPIDLTGATIAIRLRAPGAIGGALQIYAQDVRDMADYSFYVLLSAYPEMTDVSYKIPAASASYDPSKIRQVFVSIVSATAKPSCTQPSCSWRQPTLLEIDSIAFDNAPAGAPGPYTFDTGVSQMSLSSYQPTPGSTLTWIP